MSFSGLTNVYLVHLHKNGASLNYKPGKKDSAKSCPTLAIPSTVACQAPLSTGYSRQEYWSRLPFPSPEDHPSPGIEPTSPALSGGFSTTEPPGKPLI